MTFHYLDFTRGHEARGVLCSASAPHTSTTNRAWVTCPRCLEMMEMNQ